MGVSDIEDGVHSACAGGVHTLVGTWEGAIYGLGGNTCGQVGDGTFEDGTRPKLAMGKATIEVITAAERLARIMVGPSEVDEETLKAQGSGFQWEKGEGLDHTGAADVAL